MKNKKVNIIAIFLGALIFVGSMVFVGSGHLENVFFRNIACFCFILGLCTFIIGISNLFMIKYFKNNPQKLKQNEVDYSDERNTLIRYKAKAKAGDIINWFIIGIAYITIIINSPIWLSFIIVGIFLLKIVLEIHFMNKYQNEM